MRKTRIPQVGSIFLMKLENGTLMPFQIIAQHENEQISTCAIVGHTYTSEQEARGKVDTWSQADIVAEINTVSKNILDHDGSPWPDLGPRPLLKASPKKAVANRMADAIRAKLGLKGDETSFANIGLFYSLANACAGVKPWNSMARPDYFDQFLTDANHPLLKRRLK